MTWRFFFSSRRRHTRLSGDWSSDVCSSDLALAVEARNRLQAEGIPTAVVSMPCWELFDEQDEAYRAAVLGAGTVRVAVEAAARFGWDRYLGIEGGFVGMTGFGASGPADALYERFGITPTAIV